MGDKLKISIIVPVYNLQDYIERCLKSILSQTYENLEVLLVDDGSTDNSREIINKIAEYDNRVIPIFKENGGVTSARLAGIARATGEWIGFVDGDDEIEPDMYEFLLDNALKHNADISHCGYQMVFEDGRVHYFHNTGRFVKQDNATGLKDLLDGSLVEPGLCNKLFHKNLFNSLLHSNMMPEDIRINEDLLMNFYLFSQSHLSVFEDRCKYHYIVRGSSASRQKMNNNKIYDPIRVKNIILSEIGEEVREDAQRAYIRTCVYTYCALKEKEYRKDKALVRKKIFAEKKLISLLPVQVRLMANMILYVPFLFSVCYPLYVKFIQARKYD